MPSGLRRLGCRAVAFLASLVAVTILVLLALHDSHLGAWLVRENGVVEWLQVVLMAIAGVLAARQGLAAKRRGEPFALEVAIVTAMTMICIGEIDLDRVLFGVKIIHTRFFVRSPVPARLASAGGARRRGPADGRGQSGSSCTSASSGGPACAGCSSPGGRRRPSASPSSCSCRSSSAGSTVCRGSRQTSSRRCSSSWPRSTSSSDLSPGNEIIMSRMSVRPLIGILVLALGLSACRGEFPASAASQEKPKSQAPAAGPPAREVRVVPAIERALPRTVAATGTLAAEDQMTLSAKVAGRVESIDIDLGTRIRRGQAAGSARPDRLQAPGRAGRSRAAAGAGPPGPDADGQGRDGRSRADRPSCARPVRCWTRRG